MLSNTDEVTGSEEFRNWLEVSQLVRSRVGIPAQGGLIPLMPNSDTPLKMVVGESFGQHPTEIKIPNLYCNSAFLTLCVWDQRPPNISYHSRLSRDMEKLR